MRFAHPDFGNHRRDAANQGLWACPFRVSGNLIGPLSTVNPFPPLRRDFQAEYLQFRVIPEGSRS